MIIYLAAIQSIPKEYRDAARVDGANGWHVLRYVILPLLAPTTLLITVITVVGSMQVFDHILLMTGGGPANATMVLVYYIYQQGFRFFATGYASALAVVLFVVTLVLTLMQWALRSREG
jgi:multiple sugar transport system permease protein